MMVDWNEKNHRATSSKPSPQRAPQTQTAAAPTPPASPVGDNFLITVPTAHAQTDSQADDKVKCKFCSFQSDNLIELNRHEEEAHQQQANQLANQQSNQQANQPPTLVPSTNLQAFPVNVPVHVPGTNQQILLRPQQQQQQPRLMTVLRPGLTQTLLPSTKTITLPVAPSQPPPVVVSLPGRPAFQPNQPPLTVASVVSTPATQQPAPWRCPYCEVQVMSAPLLKQHLKICPSRLKDEGTALQAPKTAPCPYCEHEAESRELLGQHLQQRERQRCPEENCPQVFCEAADYKRHIKTTHYQVPNLTNKQNYNFLFT